jgi:hypothetical protein
LPGRRRFASQRAAPSKNAQPSASAQPISKRAVINKNDARGKLSAAAATDYPDAITGTPAFVGRMLQWASAMGIGNGLGLWPGCWAWS